MFKKYLYVLLVVLCTSCGKINSERLVGSWECKKNFGSNNGELYEIILSSVGEFFMTADFSQSIEAGALKVTVKVEGSWAVSNNGYLEVRSTYIVVKKATLNGKEKYMGKSVTNAMNKEAANNPEHLASMQFMGSFKLDIISDDRFNYEENGTFRCSRG